MKERNSKQPTCQELRKLVRELRKENKELKQSRNLLQEQAETGNQVVNNSPNPIFSVKRTGVIQFWNSACENTFQYGEEIIGKKFTRLLMNRRDKSILEKYIEKVFRNQSFNDLDITYKCKDKSTRFMVSRLYPVLDNKGNVSTCVLANTDITDRQHTETELKTYRHQLEEMVAERTVKLQEVNEQLRYDIKERKKSRKALEESEAKYRNLIQLTNDAIYLLYGSRFEIFNNKFQTLFGITLEDANQPDFHFMDLVAPKSRPLVRKREKQFESGKVLEPTNYEFTALDKNGNEIEVEVSVSYIKYKSGYATQGVIRDITERKLAVERLRKSEERYRAVAESAITGISIADGKENLTYANPAFASMLGYKPDELIGKNLSEFLDTNEYSRIQEMTALRKKGIINSYEALIYRRNGEPVNILVSAAPLTTAEGGYDETLAVNIDISDLKQAERERKNLEKQLFQAQKMESIGRLAGGIAHDFNNILSSIMGYAELLTVKYANPDSREGRAASIILQGGEKAANLTRQLLGFAREGKYQPVPAKINTIIKDIMQISGGLPDQGIDIRYDLEKNIETVYADVTQMEQVFSNIIVNAKDAMPYGGQLVFKTENVHLDEEAIKNFQALQPGSYVCITVTDTGIGMTENVLERIFEPFFTTKPEGKGTGLGLATVYGIIKNHDGYVYCSSEPDTGTEFKIYLPASDWKFTEETTSEDIISGSAVILVVDDDEFLLSTATDLLTTLGYKVSTAQDGIEAVRIYKNKKDIDLIILDVFMPHMSGKETYKALKQINSEVKILLMSGYGQDAHATELLRQGACGFIQKPMRLQELSKIIAQVLKS